MIDDERSLIPIPEFKTLFFTYFKDVKKSTKIYEKLLLFITVYVVNGEVMDEPNGNSDAYVSIQKLSKFIDIFNYYPIYVNTLRSKNSSDELTYIMTSNTRGSLAKQEENFKRKGEDEKHLFNLLMLVSEKLHERFKGLREAFRFLDTNHSQSISLNEFAQAIDHLRLKLSFDDIVKLYRFIDKEGKGEIGYDEFTMLDEERWRVTDPYKMM
jgi:hypothetical protein